MAWIRILHVRNFDKRKGRFTSVAFRNSSGEGGVSVISQRCVEERGVDICEHIDEYYADVASVPPVYWVVSGEEVPQAAHFVQEDSPSGDKCHHNMMGCTDKELSDLLKSKNLRDFTICTERGARALEINDVA